MTVLETVNRIFREFKRYTGDGLPGEPVNAPLPVGDPSSGVHNPKKSELRAGFSSIATDIDAGLEEVQEAVAEASAAADLAAQYVNAAASASGLGVFLDQATLEADSGLSYTGENAVTAGFVATGKVDGKVFIVAAADAEDHHFTTVGGVKFYDRGGYSSPSINQTQLVMDRLQHGLNADIVVMSDSTGDGALRWVYKFGAILGAKLDGPTVYVRQWNETVDNYAAPVLLHSGSAQTIMIWNYAISGAFATRGLGGDLLGAVVPVVIGRDPDLIFINYGHNGGDPVGIQIGLEATCVATLARLCPFSPQIIIGQNKSTLNDAMRDKVRVFNHLATAAGVGFISIHAFFEDYAIPIEDYYLDTVHPTEIASQLWGWAIARSFVYQPDASRSVGKSPYGRGPLRIAQRYVDMSTDILTSGVAIARDTTAGTWQSDGGSLKVTGDGVTAGGYVGWTVIPSSDISMYRGRWITATVFMRVPDAAPAGVAIVQLNDGISAANAPRLIDVGTGFVGVPVSIKVGTAATDVKLYVFSSFAAANTTAFWIDRWNVVDGPLPADPNPQLNAPTIISNANGVAIVYPDGEMICRKTVAANAIPINTAWGSLFQSSEISLGSWAMNFVTIASCEYRVFDAAGSITAPPLVYGAMLTAGPRGIYLWNAVSKTALNYTVVIEGRGRWQ